MLYEIHKNKTFVRSSIVLHNHRTSKHMAPQHITLSNETYTANKVMQLNGSICITERELYIANYICKMYFFLRKYQYYVTYDRATLPTKPSGENSIPIKNGFDAWWVISDPLLLTMIGTFPCVQSVASEHL